MNRLFSHWNLMLCGLAFIAAFALVMSVVAQEPSNEQPPADTPADTPAQPDNVTEGEEKMPDLPPEALVTLNVGLYPPEVLGTEFTEYRTRPFDNAALEFVISVRNDWSWFDLVVREHAGDIDFVPIAFIRAPDPCGGVVTVQVGYRVIEREVDLQDYLEAYAELLGYKILKSQWCNYSGCLVYEILAVSMTLFSGFGGPCVFSGLFYPMPSVSSVVEFLPNCQVSPPPESLQFSTQITNGLGQFKIGL